MKTWLILLLLLTSAPLMAQSTPTPTPLLAGEWNAPKVPWGLWFKNNALVTDKTEYVHFFWNANDFKANFEVNDKQPHLADAIVYLVKNLYPADAKADLVKVDIVYVLERDSYGMPKWDSLQQVVHAEFLRSKMFRDKKLPDFSKIDPAKIFDKFQIF